ncbi:MAG: peptidoglycan-binding protein [Erysipelotrichaceae bacterium]|nr:peptidoglycan-binding protein [Erysipelotrichaceae bacterium]
MAYGTLRVHVTVASSALPLEGASVTAGNITKITNENGIVLFENIEAPDASLSLDPSNTQLPYSVLDIEVRKENYQTITVRNAQIFADQVALLNMDLLPEGRNYAQNEEDIVPVHHLVNPSRYSCASFDEINENGLQQQWVLNYPIIPKTVTVHLGRPTASASNVTVSFRDYVKNVASSEIYPTWPRESLKANIYCQISLVMNRVYTEWYRSRGYSFDITNSTAFDQYYVHNRNIFESISEVVDEIFNTYIRKYQTINPYYAEYCDGRQVWCNGLKQWGTVDLANKGYNAFEILKYYYGDNIELVTTNRIEGVSGSFPGYSLKNGMRSDAVATIQMQLNRIAVNYPSIPVIYPVDGIFGAQTAASVRAFQRQFSLTADGIVGSATWYKISYIYVAVKRLAELTSEGVEAGLNFEYPGTPVRQGDRSVEVQEIQFFLNKIALFTSSVPSVKIDSSFGASTKAAVIAFQRLAGLTPDGIVGPATWNTLVEAYEDTLAIQPPQQDLLGEYPGTAVRYGDRGQNVIRIQSALNSINESNGTLMTLTVDGIFGSRTEEAVFAFQRNNGLAVDGIVGPATWNRMNQVLSTVFNNPILASALNSRLREVIYDSYTDLMWDTTVNSKTY